VWRYAEVGEVSVKRVSIEPHSRQEQWNDNNLAQLPLLLDVRRHFLIFAWLFSNYDLETGLLEWVCQRMHVPYLLYQTVLCLVDLMNSLVRQ